MTTLDRQQLATLLGPPLFAGLVLGANQTRAGAFLSWPLSIGYWIAISVATWLLFAAATQVARLVLRPWSPPRWATWFVGAIVGSLAARPAIYEIATLFRPLMDGPALRQMPPATLTLGFVSYYITNWSVIIAMWMLASWAADRWRAHSVRNAEGATAPDTIAVQSGITSRPVGFLGRLPPALGRDVLALQSEDHYVRVFTRLGDTLILTSFSDAIETLGLNGLAGQRVHRSWWIADGAVSESGTHGRRSFARLANGIEVPISQTYRETTRLSGILNPTPATG
jgi:LytTr DNA-binding domain